MPTSATGWSVRRSRTHWLLLKMQLARVEIRTVGDWPYDSSWLPCTVSRLSPTGSRMSFVPSTAKTNWSVARKVKFVPAMVALDEADWIRSAIQADLLAAG